MQEYAAQEIKNAIAFIEEHTGEKWDWKAYFECAERVNYATKCRLEWLEMNKTDYPQVFGSNLALYTETNYMAICGKVPAFREADRKITELAERAYSNPEGPSAPPMRTATAPSSGACNRTSTWTSLSGCSTAGASCR